MSHLGLGLLYAILNREDHIWAERAYAPAPDLEADLRARRQPLTSLESGTPLSRFDLLGVSLQYELGYTNLLNMLDLGGVPLLAAERPRRSSCSSGSAAPRSSAWCSCPSRRPTSSTPGTRWRPSTTRCRTRASCEAQHAAGGAFPATWNWHDTLGVMVAGLVALRLQLLHHLHRRRGQATGQDDHVLEPVRHHRAGHLHAGHGHRPVPPDGLQVPARRRRTSTTPART